MYDPYRRDSIWWIPVEMIRRLLLTSVVGVLGRQNCSLKTSAGLVVSLLFAMVFMALKPYKDRSDNLFQGIAVALPCVMMVYATSSAHLMGLQQERREKYEALKTIQTLEAKRASDTLDDEFASYEKQALAVIGLHLVLAVPFLLGGAYIILSALVIGVKDACSPRPTDDEMDAAEKSAEDTLAKQKRTHAALALPTLSEAPSDRPPPQPSSTTAAPTRNDSAGAQWFFRAAFDEESQAAESKPSSQTGRPQWFFDTAFGDPLADPSKDSKQRRGRRGTVNLSSKTHASVETTTGGPPTPQWFFDTSFNDVSKKKKKKGRALGKLTIALGDGARNTEVIEHAAELHKPGSDASMASTQSKKRRARRATVMKRTRSRASQASQATSKTARQERSSSADGGAALSLTRRRSRKKSVLRRVQSTQHMLKSEAKKKKPSFKRARSGTFELTRTMSAASLTSEDRRVQEEEINSFLDQIVDMEILHD